MLEASRGSPRNAVLFGWIVWFVLAVDLIRFVRPDLLTSHEPSWAIPRLVLMMFVAGVSAAAGILAAASFFLWSRTNRSSDPLEPIPLRRKTLCLVTLAALIFGVMVRFVWLDRVPPTIWTDEIVPVRPSLALKGNWHDLADAVRMLPGDGGGYAVAGVLYLEAYRYMLHSFGTTLFAIRFPGALAGALSLVTAMLLARALLPRGGATVAGLVLAGLRWQLILSRFAWNVMALAPIVDVATLLLIRARRRSSLAASAAGGLVAGIGAYVYLGAWIVAPALGGFLLWPQVNRVSLRRRMALAFCFGMGFLVAVSPIFLFRKDRPDPYFSRASMQSLVVDFRRTKSLMNPFTVVADSFQAPWFIPEPLSRQDLPKSRLGWIIGIPVAVTLLRAVRSPRGELSALLFPHAGAAIAASLWWGFPGHPNGYRFLYLTTVTAVAAAAGVLWLVQLFASSKRRPVMLGILGLLSVAAFLGARDALIRWGQSRETFDAYSSVATLVGRAAGRWERYGRVELELRVPYSRAVADLVREFSLDPEQQRQEKRFFGPKTFAGGKDRCFWIADATAAPRRGERRAEVIQDAWGRNHAVVLASRCPASRFVEAGK